MDKVTADALSIDPERVADEIAEALRRIVSRELHRRGAVVGVSGGVDSSVTAGLCAHALGSERTLALLMPEADSDPDTLDISSQVADAFGLETVVEDITPILEATGCYERREEAVRNVIPQYGAGWRFKIVLPSVVASEGNRLEYDQGFFVKLGDGAADAKPIAHLYKSQVYQLGRFLGVPDAVLDRPPTTDTYSLPQSQEEFYFSLPYEGMDLCLFAHDQGLPPEAVADAVSLTPEQVQRVYDDIDQKRRTTRYLHLAPQLVESVFGD